MPTWLAGGKVWLIVGIVLVFMVTSCCVLKQASHLIHGERWNWRQWRWEQKHDPKPPAEWSLGVSAVPTGASIEVKTGLRERKTAIVALAYISSPPSGDPFAEVSRAALEALAGKTIRVVEVKAVVDALNMNNRADLDVLDGQKTGFPSTTEKASALGKHGQVKDGPPEARLPAVGICYGASGTPLALAQLQTGWADVLPGAPAEYVAARDAARKAKKGKWQ